MMEAALGGARIAYTSGHYEHKKEDDNKQGFRLCGEVVMERVTVKQLINRYLCAGANSLCVSGACDLCAFGRRYRELTGGKKDAG